jgi:hypothetical protein
VLTEGPRGVLDRAVLRYEVSQKMTHIYVSKSTAMNHEFSRRTKEDAVVPHKYIYFSESHDLSNDGITIYEKQEA